MSTILFETTRVSDCDTILGQGKSLRMPENIDIPTKRDVTRCRPFDSVRSVYVKPHSYFVRIADATNFMPKPRVIT